MKGEERRNAIIKALDGKTPVSASVLADRFGVSRQIIVQDISQLRKEGREIVSTPKGYLSPSACTRVFKVRHEDDRTEEELTLIVDEDGLVRNVFVHHRVYGMIEGELNVGSRVQIAEYIRSITAGKSSLLKNVTDGYHYHAVTAADEETLDRIEDRLREHGFLIEQ